jgi:hypothetical protein
LDALRFYVADHVVMVLQDGLAQVAGQALNRVLGDTRDSGCGTDGNAVNEAADDGTALFVGQSVHVFIICLSGKTALDHALFTHLLLIYLFFKEGA